MHQARGPLSMSMLMALSACAAQPSTEPAEQRLAAEGGMYIPCETAEDCAPEARCTTPGAEIRTMCLPATGLGIDQTDVAEDDCPEIDADHTQKRYYNLHCVLECDTDAACPAELPRCLDNPFSAAGPHEAKRFCAP